MFSAALTVSNGCIAWNTKPIRSRRTLVSWPSLTEPQVEVTEEHPAGTSVCRAPRACITVSCPSPTGP